MSASAFWEQSEDALGERHACLLGSSSWNTSVLQLYLMVHVLCFRKAAKWHFIPTSELYAIKKKKKVNFHAFFWPTKCLQDFYTALPGWDQSLAQIKKHHWDWWWLCLESGIYQVAQTRVKAATIQPISPEPNDRITVWSSAQNPWKGQLSPKYYC